LAVDVGTAATRGLSAVPRLRFTCNNAFAGPSAGRVAVPVHGRFTATRKWSVPARFARDRHIAFSSNLRSPGDIQVVRLNDLRVWAVTSQRYETRPAWLPLR
jgi:hypothetical protein